MTSNTTYRLESVERGAKGFLNFGDENNKDQPIWIYDRLDEPNNLMLEEQLAYLEKGESAVTFASGMGAISAVCLATLKSGDTVLSDPTIYGCTYSLFTNWLPKFNLDIQWKDSQKENFLDNPPDSLRLVYLESVANPNLKVAPLKKICDRVKELNKTRTDDRKILVAIDNTFATPIGCNPISLGADFAIQSLTKNIAGFGTELGGAVVCPKAWNIPIKVARKDFGAVLNSKSSWHILNHGVPTLNLRFKKQQENARKIAHYLESKASDIESLLYPGLESHPNFKDASHTLTQDEDGNLNAGFMIAFTLKGNNDRTKKFVNYLAKESYSITLAVSLGLTKTLIEVPRLMTHSSLDDSASLIGEISEKLVRLSVGIENYQDIIDDLETAFDHIK
jgi:methionine-gamma-lyase